jgi:hypothetical protein
MLRPQCTNCLHVNPPGSNFCIHCGSRLPFLACAYCSALNDAEAHACYRCAAVLPERRQTAMAVECKPFVVGAYSQRDPLADDAAAILRLTSTANDRAVPRSFGSARTAESRSSSPWKEPRGRSGVRTWVFAPVLLAALGAIAFYVYRDPLPIAAQRPSSTEVTGRVRYIVPDRRPAEQVNRNQDDVSDLKQGARVGPEEQPGCTQAIEALGLCSWEITARRTD